MLTCHKDVSVFASGPGAEAFRGVCKCADLAAIDQRLTKGHRQ